MSVRKGQARLRKIATQISSDAPLSDEDQAFLATALQTIADGGDADTALGVKAKKGERKSHYARNTAFNKQLFFGWIKVAIAAESERRAMSEYSIPAIFRQAIGATAMSTQRH